MKFKEWKLEVQRLLYENDHGAFNISTVDEAEEYWEEMYNDKYTPSEAIEITIENASDTP